MNKTRYFSLLFLNFIYSCKSTTSASDASVTAAFIITIVIFLTIVIVGVHANYEEKQEIKKAQRKEEVRRKIYNSPKEEEKRRISELKRQKKIEKNKLIRQKKTEQNKLIRQKKIEQKKIDYKNFRKENPHLFNSSKNLKLSIQNLSEFISECKKCENRHYTVWELFENNLIIRCDVCKRKSTINNDLVNDIFNNYNYYLKLYDYCTPLENKINITWKKFKFDRKKFKINTPLYRGLTFQSFGTKQTEETIIEPEKRSRTITQEVKDKVWNRDGGKCVECGSNENLEFDHIIPHSKGGANTYRNIQLLCEPCNRSKSAKIG